MRWLLISLLVSVVALLLAAAGMARHIWLRRSGARNGQVAGLGLSPVDALDPAAETDIEPEL